MPKRTILLPMKSAKEPDFLGASVLGFKIKTNYRDVAKVEVELSTDKQVTDLYEKAKIHIATWWDWPRSEDR